VAGLLRFAPCCDERAEPQAPLLEPQLVSPDRQARVRHLQVRWWQGP
jgi:hypothetical protein